MVIAVTVKEKDNTQRYPKLKIMQEIGTIVLFTDDGMGTVVSGTKYSIGHWSSQWKTDEFEDFEGIVTLEG